MSETLSSQRLTIVSRPLGGEIAQRALTGALDAWYARPPDNADGWRAYGERVRNEFADRDWRAALAPALGARGPAAERLARADVVVTTGQQPGLFGGPLYTIHKALSALALANVLERETGVRVAPVFWAATDDADFAEASHVGVVSGGSYVELATTRPDAGDGASMSAVPLGDVSALLAQLERACGSAPNRAVVEAVAKACGGPATVGSAYVALLREILEPLGIAVLDASHAAVRTAAAPTLRAALRNSSSIESALTMRTSEIERAGLRAQVPQIAKLSLVFVTDENGARRRIAIDEAARIADEARDTQLSPNVLLRPVMERQILPTVTYVGGPGEIAYFAQVSAVATPLAVAVPLVVPRWSGIIVEPEVAQALERLGMKIDDLRDPHAAETRIARTGLAPAIRDALARVRESLNREAETLETLVGNDESLRRSVGSMRATAEFRVDRLERRLAASQKRHDDPALRDVRFAQASLYPGGAPQERVLSYVPLLARYGDEYTRGVIAAASTLATEIVRGV